MTKKSLRTQTEGAPWFSVSPASERRRALEDSRRLMRLSGLKFASVLKVLSKCAFGHLYFHFGDVEIGFEVNRDFDSCFTRIVLAFETKNGKITKKAEYEFTPSELGFTLP